MEGQTHLVYHAQRPLSPSAVEFLKLLRQWRDNNSTRTDTSIRSVPRAHKPVAKTQVTVG